MDYIVETENLTKQFPKKLALDHVSMHIRKGDIYGFIGKNGAGKTTTMKLLLGMILPTDGKMKLFGSEDLTKQRRRIGSLIEAPGIYKNASAFENMKRFSLLSGGTDQEIRDILTLVGLADTGSRKAGGFSLGMKQRLGIAIALLGNSELLILDEPINGLDPAAIKEVRETLLRLNQERGTTILISSHILDELAKITTNYGIINDGKLVEEITSEDLMKRCQNNLRIKVSNPENAYALIQEKGLAKDAKYEIKDGCLYLYDEKTDSALINRTLIEDGYSVSEITYNENGFEQFFIERIGR